ncbi:MAG: trypsin-like serine protease [Hyphomicrobiales bacterium]|nr:trypsin-like serine protease [Hyphomicrobiales bacterium]
MTSLSSRVAVGLPGLLLAGCLAILPGTASAVIGGHPVRGSDPARQWTVKIESSKGELCSGVPIEARIVLTAAHCVMKGGTFRVSVIDGHMKRRTIVASHVVAHETFLPGRSPSTQPGVDLAMLRLSAPLPPAIRPVTMGGRIGVGDVLTIAGFGLSREGQASTARTLRQTSLTSAGRYTSANSVMVAVDTQTRGQAPGAGACKGDSGGPIMRGDTGSSELVGIVSWSSGPAVQRVRSVCGGFTAITPVADHAGWLSSTARALSAMLDDGPQPERRRGGRQERGPQPPASAAEPWMRPDSNN